MIAHFPFENICEVEKHATNLEAIADKWYSSKVENGTGIAFSELVLRDDAITDPTVDPTADAGVGGESFQGIDDTGVWILALYCTTCLNPVPKFMTVLHPCGN